MRKKERFVLGKRTFRSQKSKHFVLRIIYTILLLIVSNIFMTFAWYGHLKLQETKVISNWPLYAVVLFSWVIALAEYNKIEKPNWKFNILR